MDYKNKANNNNSIFQLDENASITSSIFDAFGSNNISFMNNNVPDLFEYNGRLVCCFNKQGLDKEIPVLHYTLNSTYMGLFSMSRMEFYEQLNSEIAYFSKLYENTKYIGLKAFYINEAHLSCEWLCKLIEEDDLFFVKSISSDKINKEAIIEQRDSINAIRNEIYTLLLHPAFSCPSVTPMRILRLPRTKSLWSSWQTELYTKTMNVYMKICKKSVHRDSPFNISIDDIVPQDIYCTSLNIIIFIYDDVEREQCKKPISIIKPLSKITKKYKLELKEDPYFVAFSNDLEREEIKERNGPLNTYKSSNAVSKNNINNLSPADIVRTIPSSSLSMWEKTSSSLNLQNGGESKSKKKDKEQKSYIKKDKKEKEEEEEAISKIQHNKYNEEIQKKTTPSTTTAVAVTNIVPSKNKKKSIESNNVKKKGLFKNLKNMDKSVIRTILNNPTSKVCQIKNIEENPIIDMKKSNEKGTNQAINDQKNLYNDKSRSNSNSPRYFNRASNNNSKKSPRSLGKYKKNNSV